jgi:hypothetical protein
MISVSGTRDIPLLLLIRDSRAISISQLIAELMLDAIETSSRSIHWRLSRLIASGFVEKVGNDRAIGEILSELPEYKPFALTVSLLR